jgi:xanthine dehydrogenase YagR molybdenum-binding subunit
MKAPKTELDGFAYLEQAAKQEGQAEAVSAAPGEFRYVGQKITRVDGRLIVTGKAPYTHDLHFEGMLYGKILRSPHAAAEVVSVDLSPALRLPGVMAAVKLTSGRVRYIGEPIAAVAAVDEATAAAAAQLIQVEYKVLPFVVSEKKAMEDGAPQVLDSPNVQKLFEYTRGNIKEGEAQADMVIERTYHTSIEVHHPAETHASIAYWKDGRLNVWDSTQAIFSVRDQLARVLNIPASQVRVIKKYMGGGFGSKLGLNDHTVAAALLAKEAQRPVKIVLSRRENAYCVGNRPSALITIRGGAKKDGTLTFLHLKNYTGGGVGRGDRCSEPLIDIYRCPHVLVEEYSVFTNTCASRPTRAPGHVQGTFALESFLEELAAALNLDPLELRRKNYSEKNLGDTGLPYSSKGLLECYRLGAEAIGWSRRNQTPGQTKGKIRRGIGMATQIWWGAGVPGTIADLKVYPDGAIEAICGTQDLGGGTRTYIATIIADTLGLEPQDITIRIGDTDFPWAPSSGGSQTTPSVGPAFRDAALKAAARLKAIAAKKLNCPPENVEIGEHRLFDKAKPESSISFGEVVRELRRVTVFHGERSDLPAGFAYNSFGAHFAEVEVDIETGKVRVVKVVAAHEVGRVVNRLTAESQVVGGVTQGLSASLFEQRLMDDNEGRCVTTNLVDYKIAAFSDIPEIIPIFVDSPDPRVNNLGSKGLGEPPRIPIAAAVANAVYNALGTHPRQIPMTPEIILSTLKAKEAEP